jgi:hypothetical protein
MHAPRPCMRYWPTRQLLFSPTLGCIVQLARGTTAHVEAHIAGASCIVVKSCMRVAGNPVVMLHGIGKACGRLPRDAFSFLTSHQNLRSGVHDTDSICRCFA